MKGLILFFSMMTLWVVGCAPVAEVPEVCKKYEGTSDYGACQNAPESYQLKEDAKLAVAMAAARATILSPKALTLDWEKPAVVSTDVIVCKEVIGDEGIGETSQRANIGGQFPPYSFAGSQMLVGHYVAGELQGIYNLQQLMAGEIESPITHVEEEICLSTNRNLLENR